MAKYRNALPQLGGAFFLTEGGLETTLIFLEGQELPLFAAFHLLTTPAGTAALRKYFTSYAEIARRHRTGVILETPTWRANPDWGAQLGYTRDDLAAANRASVALLEEFRRDYETDEHPVVISGCIGPRGDGYVPDSATSAREAQEYHSEQIETFADTAADLVTGITMNYAEEAIGLVEAARDAKLPVVVSLTVETDGTLPTGQPLGEAIRQIDTATGSYSAYFMLNCAHPSHFAETIRGDEPWAERLRGLRANASRMSHAELNEATELDAGDPVTLAGEYAALRRGQLRKLNVMGGCCGTDHRHVEQIAIACGPGAG